ncbi:MAG: class I SAM-dependent methyltransferase [Candidatus Fermentibacteraceae bacterium]|nr:class I SAM-dependent methyltransferase [Candidatus Fermentibacteraceae bacterium]MBN2608559.1 class I SAM-dependent methyltransferase [Candidatus Fermentibacteraceae bacterium]
MFSMLPLGSIGRVFEPGCGTGLLGRELRNLTDAVYTGMDLDSRILPGEDGFFHGDALSDPREADLYVASFFFSSIREPVEWLRRVRDRLSPGGLFAVFGEYDYEATVVSPDGGLGAELLSGLRRSGLHTGHGGRLDDYFSKSGFFRKYGGEVLSTSRAPDREFLAMHVEHLPDLLPEMKWRIVWGIWRK